MSSYYNYKVIPKLNKILKERNITQKELAELTGISQAAISRFDKNGQHVDTYLVAISRTLGITIEDLFDIEEQLVIDIDIDK